MKQREILISGASVAGPALAYWLVRHGGFRVTIVERGGPPVGGGYKVDLRGAALDVITRMGLTEAVAERGAELGGISVVDERGKVIAKLDQGFGFAEEGDVEILRGDLAALLYAKTRDDVEYVFHDAIASISYQPDRVTVTFEHAEPREFDLVIGADGIHSNVRSLAFGAERDFLHDLGFHGVSFSIPNYLELDRWGYLHARPQGLASVYSTCGRADAHVTLLFLVADELRERLRYGLHDRAAQMEIVSQVHQGAGWEIPRFLEEMPRAADFAFQAVSYVVVDGWSRGRVALVGDAAWGPTFSGEATSQALVGGYVLAGELARERDAHETAFRRYESVMRPWVLTNPETGRELVCHLLGASREHHWWHMQALRVLPWLPFARPFARKLRAKRPGASITLADYGV